MTKFRLNYPGSYVRLIGCIIKIKAKMDVDSQPRPMDIDTLFPVLTCPNILIGLIDSVKD